MHDLTNVCLFAAEKFDRFSSAAFRTLEDSHREEYNTQIHIVSTKVLLSNYIGVLCIARLQSYGLINIIIDIIYSSHQFQYKRKTGKEEKRTRNERARTVQTKLTNGLNDTNHYRIAQGQYCTAFIELVFLLLYLLHRFTSYRNGMTIDTMVSQYDVSKKQTKQREKKTQLIGTELNLKPLFMSFDLMINEWKKKIGRKINLIFVFVCWQSVPCMGHWATQHGILVFVYFNVMTCVQQAATHIGICAECRRAVK